MRVTCEFFGEEHGGVGEVDVVVAHEGAEGEFGVAHHGGGDVERAIIEY